MKLLKCLLIFALFACSAEGEKEATPTTESSEPSIHGEALDYSANGTTLKGYLAYDQNVEGPRPGVLVVHEWWGHNEYARERARQLAALGYTALAVDMYGDGKQADHPDDAGKFASEVMQNIDAAEARFRAAMEALQNQPVTNPEKIAAIGYCFGGSVVLHMARIGMDLDAVASFHGGLSSMHTPDSGSVKAKILVCSGGADPMVPQEQIEAFRNEMDAAGAAYEIMVFEGAQHSFTNPDADKYAEQFGLPVGYDADAAQQSWDALKNLLREAFQN